MGRLASIIAITAVTLIPLTALKAMAADDQTPPPAPDQKHEQKADGPKADEQKAPAPGTEQAPSDKKTQESPWDAAAPVLKKSLHNCPSLALIQPEFEGMNRQADDLQDWLQKTLSQVEGLIVVPPDQVQARAGLGFAISAQGLGRIARKSQTKAALFVRLIHSPEGTDLMLLMVDDKEQIMLDQALAIDKPAQPEPPPPPTPQAQVKPEEQEQDPQSAFEGDGQREEENSEAELPGDPIVQGPSSEEIYALRQLNLQARPGRPQGFIIQRSDRAIGELELAQMTGRQDLVQRIQKNVEGLSFKRSLGMGMTLAGFAAAGMASPLYKSSKSGGELAGALITGLGAATGVAGAVIWYLYGAEAEAAGGPSPVEHLLTRDEAQHMIRAYNSALQRELNIPRAPADPAKNTANPEVGFQWLIAPGPNSICALATIRY